MPRIIAGRPSMGRKPPPHAEAVIAAATPAGDAKAGAGCNGDRRKYEQRTDGSAGQRSAGAGQQAEDQNQDKVVHIAAHQAGNTFANHRGKAGGCQCISNADNGSHHKDQRAENIGAQLLEIIHTDQAEETGQQAGRMYAASPKLLAKTIPMIEMANAT